MIYQISAIAVMVTEGGKEKEVPIMRRIRAKTEEEACAMLSIMYRLKEICGAFAFSTDNNPIDDGKNYAAVNDGRFVMDI